MREGNHILGVYACDPDRPPVAIRYLVDPDIPGAEIVASRDGKSYTVWWASLISLVDNMSSGPPYNSCYMRNIMCASLRLSVFSSDLCTFVGQYP